MKVDPSDYRYRVCPSCKSKKVPPVGLYRMDPAQWVANLCQINRTGYLCGNCGRYHRAGRAKFITDRAEMRRDMERLFLYLSAEDE